ncbi:MAG: hypothetical protein K2Q14_08025 [Gammaproteobacteria bacterium]|nr:hypothetical protein [Gammaproteobacteria bacterium]
MDEKKPFSSIPIAKIGTVPVGLSLVAGYRKDDFLLTAAKQLFGSEPY